MKCHLWSKPERKELLQNTDCFIWDEFPSNHKECFEAAFEEMDRFQGKVFVGMGDFKQILPVVVLGEENDILEASIFSSHLWEIFVQLFLDINMRLSKVSIDSEDYGAQMEYSSLLKSIGHGVQCCDSFNLVSDISDSDALVLLLNVNYFTLPLKRKTRILTKFSTGCMKMDFLQRVLQRLPFCAEQTKLSISGIPN